MRKLTTLLAVMVFLFTACASQSVVPPQILETAKSVCAIYENAKPKVVAFVEWAESVWDTTIPGTDQPVLPANVKALLLEFRSYLPTLDDGGKIFCAFITPGAQASPSSNLKSANWDRILAVTLQVVDVAAQFAASRQVSENGRGEFYLAPAGLRIKPLPEFAAAVKARHSRVQSHVAAR